MCGLFGSVSFPPDSTRIDMVAHRGPDGFGWQEFASPTGPVALGHRRLAIIDVSDNGLQPMADPSGRFHLVFNGEIYNYLELREELKAAGHCFRSDTDTEVLIEAYRAWGEGCLDRLVGMFAFLIWDDRDKRLFAARDRFGIKPLYVLANCHGVAFASEIKQLIGLPGSSARMNVARVRDFLISGTSDHTAETMFEGVLHVQPGCCVSIDASNLWNGRFNAQRWYAIPSHSTLQLSEDDAAERFRDLLVDSVRMHLRSDVPVGSCLSGGLDSSSTRASTRGSSYRRSLKTRLQGRIMSILGRKTCSCVSPTSRGIRTSLSDRLRSSHNGAYLRRLAGSASRSCWTGRARMSSLPDTMPATCITWRT